MLKFSSLPRAKDKDSISHLAPKSKIQTGHNVDQGPQGFPLLCCMLCQSWTSRNCGVPCLKASGVTRLKASGVTQSEQAAAVYNPAGDKHNVDGESDLNTD